MSSLRKLRDLPGVLLRDLSRYRHAFARSGAGRSSERDGWIALCNRIEHLSREEGRRGVVCEWQWGSPLHAPTVLPMLGRQLMRASLEEWPIRFAPGPIVLGAPRASFIFAHAGVERLPQLVRTIQSVFAQSIPCECIVVDQSPEPLFRDLPAGIIYRHLAKQDVRAGWHKSWAYNVGARIARSPILVFQDGDVCPPVEYAAELARVIGTNCAAASLQRLLFYLDFADTLQLDQTGAIGPDFTPTMAFQNWKGGTIAVAREAFKSIGGFDEGFVDWGGEDDEFYDRCASIGHCRAGFLPFVHLWHAPQPDRKVTTNPNIADVMPWRMGMSHAERIAELGARRWGNSAGPDPAISYKDQRGNP